MQIKNWSLFPTLALCYLSVVMKFSSPHFFSILQYIAIMNLQPSYLKYIEFLEFNL